MRWVNVMANKIEAAIRKLLNRNTSTAERLKKRKVAEAATDTMVTDEEALSRELARRQKFANKPLPDVLKEKRKKLKQKGY